jgi:Bacteriophage head to tail connecting protein
VKKLNDVDLVDYVLHRHETLKHKRAPWDAFWQDVGEFCMPRKAEIMSSTTAPTTHRDAVLFDSTMIYANMVLSNGCMSYLTPADSRWFSFDPPAHLKGDDESEQYCRHCSEIASMELANSNFYTEIHELYLDRGCYGTACLYCEEGRRTILNFRKFDVGTFSIAEDEEGYVDTLSREFLYTARQAVQKFGIDNVSETIRTAFESGKSDQMDREFLFIHQIFPRADDEVEFGKKDARNMPIASIYIEKEKKHLSRVSGYIEFPFFATRYLRWMNEHCYGWSPAWMALPEARQLNFLQKQMDALAELAAFPRFLIPDTHEGEIDYRAAGVTYYDANNPNAIPQEWATQGKYDIGKDRVEMKKEVINRCFHVDMFQMFAQLERPQMTAREVTERASEKLVQFSPTFARLTSELYTPLLRRVWGLLTRAGKMPPPPKQLLVEGPQGLMVPEPNVVYASRIALAIKNLENASLMAMFEMWSPVAELKPEIFDNANWDEMFRDSVRNAGLPARWLVEMDHVAEIRKQRAKQMEEQKKMMQQGAAADAIGKVGSVKEDSLVGKALTSRMNGEQ